MPDITLDPSFWSRALATLIGTVAGFIFSIALFYISECVKRSQEKNKLIVHVKREAAFNVGLCDGWIKSLADIRLKVAASDRAFYNYLDYTRCMRVFTQEAFKAGVIYDLLSDAELIDLDKALRFLFQTAEQDINSKITQWKATLIAAPEMSQALTFHEFAVGEARKAIACLRDKAAAA